MNFDRRARSVWRPPAANHPLPANTITSAEIQVERKTFLFQLQENERGQFLRISETANDRTNAIVIPASGLDDFKRILDGLIKDDSAGQ